MENNITEKEFSETAQQTAVMQPVAPVQDEADKPVGFWAYFGLILLFAIPVVGFIACIVFMFAPQRKSMKNYARAVMAWMVINFVSTIAVLSILLSVVGNLLLPMINVGLGTNFNSFNQLVSIATDAASGNYADVIAQMRPQLEDMMGEEMAPVLDEVSKPEYNEFFRQIVNEDYSALLSDLQEGQYPNLKNALGEEIYDEFMTELQSAANGEYSEVFEEIRDLIPDFF